MTKKIVKKTKIKLMNLLLVLLVLVGLFFGIQKIIKEPIHSIVIKGTTYLNDDTILDLGDIKDYPGFLLLKRKKTCKKIMKSEYVSSCKIKKKLGFNIEVIIEENRPLFYDMNQNQYILQNSVGVNSTYMNDRFRVPRLLNYVPDTKFNKRGTRNPLLISAFFTLMLS